MTTLVFELLAKDLASKVFNKVGSAGGHAASAISKLSTAGGVAGRGLGAVGRTAAGVTKAFAGLGLAAGAVAGKIAKDSITAATDLNETVSKTGVIFGKATPEIVKFGDLAAKALGQSKQEALDGAATFGIFGKSAGLSGKNLANFSIDMTKLASDLASFNNTNPAEAVEAIGAALRGESEPIRSYGVLLDDATLRQRALALGLVKTTKEALTPQNKVLAAQAEIMAQTKLQQGDFARTSGSLANQQRVLSAQFENVKASIGQKLLPVALSLVTVANDKLIPAFGKVGGFLTQLGPAFQQVGGFVKAFLNGLMGGTAGGSGPLVAFTTAGGMLRDILTSLFNSVRSNLPAIQAFGAQLLTLAREAAPVVAAAIKTIISVAAQIRATVLPIITQVASTLVAAFRENLPQIREALTTITTIVKDTLQVIRIVWAKLSPILLPIVKVVFGVVVKTVGAALRIVSGLVKTVLSLIRGDWSGAWSGIKSTLKAVWDGIKAIVGGALRILWLLLGDALKSIGGAFARFWGGVKKTWSDGLAFIKSIPKRVRDAFANAGKWLYSAGRDIIRGLISGIRNMARAAVNAAKGVVDDAVAGAKNVLGIGSPSKVFRTIGMQTMEGLSIGLERSYGTVQRQLAALVAEMQNTALAATPMPSNLGLRSRIQGPQTLAPATVPQSETVIRIDSGGSAMDDLLVDILRRAIRTRGGNVQKVMGRN